MQRSARIPESLIDTSSIAAASQFLFENNLTTNCWLRESVNFADLMSRWGKYHLLRLTTINGKLGLRPLLPTLENGAINTFNQTLAYTFTDDLVIPGSVDIRYSSWNTRQPFVAQMIWRQEFEDCPSIIRTTEVRYAGTAPNGPYESHDLSAFCTREEHAVRVGAYILSKRVRSTHAIRFKVRPQSHNTLVTQGSLVRVRLARNPFSGSAGFHDYYYEVERITKTLAGDVQYECSHAPVGEDLQSLIAVDVANAQESMTFFACNFTGVGCDVNGFDDTTPLPDDEFLIPDEDPPGEIPPIDPGDFPVIDPGGGGGGGGGSGEPEPEPDPDDGLDPIQLGPMQQCPLPGGEGVAPVGVCEGATITRIMGNIGDESNAIRETVSNLGIPLTPPDELGGDDWNGKFVVFEYECPDGTRQVSDPCNEPGEIAGPNPCSREMVWPTGTWDPNGENKWSYIVTQKISHGEWFGGGTSCENPRQLNDAITTVRTGPGEVAWYKPPVAGNGPCEGIKQYGDGFIYISRIDEICQNYISLVDFVRTAGTRSHAIAVTVEPVQGGPTVEVFPTRQGYADQYL
jgi:hypothetical protein